MAITAHQRKLSGNPQLSQEQVVAELIQAAQRQLEKNDNQVLPLPAPLASEIPASLENSSNQTGLQLTSTTTAAFENSSNQILPVELAATAATITTLRQDVNALVATLRTKSAVGQRDGKRLIALLTKLITFHATQIAPWAILEELDRPHRDDTDRNQAIATLRERPLAEYRQDGWTTALQRIAAQLDTGPIRRQAAQWDFINLAVEISGATLVTNDRIADLTTRLQANGIDVSAWLTLAEQDSPSIVTAIVPVRAALTPEPQAEITGVLLRSGKRHDLGAIGKTRCGQFLPPDLDDVTWIRDPAFVPTCRRCQTLRLPVITTRRSKPCSTKIE